MNVYIPIHTQTNWIGGLLGLVVALLPLSAVRAQSSVACRDSLTGRILGQDRKGAAATPLPGATVYLKETQQGAAADADGRFRLTNLCPGRYTVEYRFEGYTPLVRQLQVSDSATTLRADTVITLFTANINLQEVVVTEHRSEAQQTASVTE